MSKRMAKFLTYWTLMVVVQLYALAIYQYGEVYGFDHQINPATILLSTMVIIGLLGLVGRYLNNRDMKRGYCDSGISQDTIDAYQTSRTATHNQEDNPKTTPCLTGEKAKSDHEDDDDPKR